MLDSIPDVIFFKDLNGVYLGCNPAFCEIVQLSKDKIIGKTDYDLIDIALADLFRKNDLETINNLLPTRNEAWLTYPDGRKALMDTLKTPYWAYDGTLLGVLGVSRDITERKASEEQIKESEQRLQLVMEVTQEGVWDWHIPSGKVAHGLQWYTLLGAKPGEIADTVEAFGNLIHQEDKAAVFNRIDEVLQGKTGKYYSEHRLIGREGMIWVRDQGAIVERDPQGNPVRMLGSYSDISERIKAEAEIKLQNEKLLKLNNERDKFFSIIAHDLRGPLGGFMGLTELLADDNQHFTEPERKEMMSELSHSARNTFHLLENLLEWSQMDRGLSDFEPQKLDLAEVVTECVNIATEQARLKTIGIVADIPGKTEVLADRNMLQTVIRNLLSNAIKFTHDGGRITISASKAKNKLSLISVKDTGIGMTDDMRNNLFCIDAKINRPGTRGEHSTGLGLHLCKEFVEKHGGEIRVESEQGKGTVFSFTIPSSVEPQEKNDAKEVIKISETQSEIGNLTILIAEDDGISAKLISLMVKGFSKQVFHAKTGAEAVDICRSNPEIDMVLMDIAMPVMDGYEATREIRLFNKEVIIIAQTTFVLSSDREKAIRVGFNDFLEKPLSKDTLSELIKKHA